MISSDASVQQQVLQVLGTRASPEESKASHTHSLVCLPCFVCAATLIYGLLVHNLGVGLAGQHFVVWEELFAAGEKSSRR